MKTKIVLVGVALVACVWPVGADEKEDAKMPAPSAPTVKPQISNGAIDYSDFDSGFVQSLPKDKSDFTVKPPQGAVIGKLVPQKLPGDKIIVPPQFALPPVPLRQGAQIGDTILNRAKLGDVLSIFEKLYKVKIVLCFAPSRDFENPEISMRLRGKTVDEMLDGLKILGLAWRKTGDTYFVAWSENDLPPTPQQK